jgi:hypothetical protein
MWLLKVTSESRISAPRRRCALLGGLICFFTSRAHVHTCRRNTFCRETRNRVKTFLKNLNHESRKAFGTGGHECIRGKPRMTPISRIGARPARALVSAASPKRSFFPPQRLENSDRIYGIELNRTEWEGPHEYIRISENHGFTGITQIRIWTS